MKYIVTTLLVSFSHFIIGQNLVPNPSFEDTIAFPNNYLPVGTLDYTLDWFQPTIGTSDYLHEAGSDLTGVPLNIGGYQEANSGNAYAGLITYNSYYPGFEESEYREYISIQLLEPLVHAKEYIVEFYVSLAEKLYTSKIGARFSNSAINVNTIGVLNFDPHVEQTNPVTNKLHWELLSFDYTANGDEKYLTIGNFRADSLSDTLNLNDMALNSANQMAYYYIDDVAVYENTTGIADNSVSGVGLNVYPNPTSGQLTITLEEEVTASIFIRNSLGQLVLSDKMNGKVHKVEFNSPPGIYFLQLESNGQFYTEMVIKE